MAKANLAAARKALEKATGIKRSKNEDEQSYLNRLANKVGGRDDPLSDEDWDKLPKDAQDWYNDAAKAIKAKTEIPSLGADEAEDEPAPRTRARVDDDDDAPKPRTKASTADDDAPPDPMKGDYVIVTKTNDTKVSGVVTDIEDGDLTIKDDDGNEVAIRQAKVKSIKIRKAEKAEDEPPKHAEPKKGDKVEVTMKDGEIHKGEFVSQDDRYVTIEQGDDEVDFKMKLVERVRVKSDPKDAKPETKPTSKANGEDKSTPAAKTTKTKPEAEAKKPVTVRIREVICEKPGRTKEQVLKIIEDEGGEVKGTTLDITYAEVGRTLSLLREYGHLQ